MKTSMKLVIVLGATTILQGCIAAGAAVGGLGVSTAVQERSVGDRIDDNGIALRINDAFIQTNGNLFTDITTTIFEGRVLLTGGVKTEQARTQAEEMVWKINGVTEVINEIQINQADFVDYSKDVLIANGIRSKLLFTKDIKSSNYATSVVNGIVYMIGIAQNENERANAVEIARRIKGVQKVVSYVILASDPRRAKANAKNN